MTRRYIHVVLLQHRHYASCLAWNFVTIVFAVTLIDCFVLDVLSVSLAAKELTSVSEKWQYIGEELGVEQHLVDYISTNFSEPGDCLTRVFFERLRHHTTSWGDVIAVLRSSRVGEFQLADQLEAKCYPSELTQLTFTEYNLWKYCPGSQL